MRSRVLLHRTPQGVKGVLPPQAGPHHAAPALVLAPGSAVQLRNSARTDPAPSRGKPRCAVYSAVDRRRSSPHCGGISPLASNLLGTPRLRAAVPATAPWQQMTDPEATSLLHSGRFVDLLVGDVVYALLRNARQCYAFHPHSSAGCSAHRPETRSPARAGQMGHPAYLAAGTV